MASVFSMIIEGKLPGSFVWQDEQCVAIMTIAPIREGHVLLIPRQEIDHFDDLPAALAAHLMVVSQKIAKGIKQAYPCERVGMMIAGLEVPHVHLHLMPIDELQDLSFAKAQQAQPEALANAAARIRSALQQQGHAEANLDA